MTDGFFGQRGLTASTSDYNAHDFQIEQALGKVRTSVPVKIVAVHGGGVGAAPTVDVQPLVNQIDGQGNQTPHGIIYGRPCTRNQGGGNAIINDPLVGDIGHLVISDRDISSLTSNEGAQSNPGSFRMHDMADGVYHGAMLNPANPTQYVQFTETGMRTVDKNGNVIVTGPAGINLNGVIIDLDGNITTPGGVTAGFGTGDSVTLQHHKHAGGPPPDPGT